MDSDISLFSQPKKKSKLNSLKSIYVKKGSVVYVMKWGEQPILPAILTKQGGKQYYVPHGFRMWRYSDGHYWIGETSTTTGKVLFRFTLLNAAYVENNEEEIVRGEWEATASGAYRKAMMKLDLPAGTIAQITRKCNGNVLLGLCHDTVQEEIRTLFALDVLLT